MGNWIETKEKDGYISNCGDWTLRGAIVTHRDGFQMQLAMCPNPDLGKNWWDADVFPSVLSEREDAVFYNASLEKFIFRDESHVLDIYRKRLENGDSASAYLDNCLIVDAFITDTDGSNHIGVCLVTAEKV